MKIINSKVEREREKKGEIDYEKSSSDKEWFLSHPAIK
jgi:hypothetical protein